MPGRGGLRVLPTRVGDAGAGAGPPACGRAKQCPPPPIKSPAAVSGPVVVFVFVFVIVAAAPLAGAWCAGEIGWGAGAGAGAVPLGGLCWADGFC